MIRFLSVPLIGLLVIGSFVFVLGQPQQAAAQTAAPAPLVPPKYAPIPGVTSQYGDFRGMFESLSDPKIIAAAKLTELEDDEEVLGLTLAGQSRAYPARFIAWHHIINDTLGGRPIIITYCSVCNSGVAYDPVFGGKRHLFDVYGLYRGVMAMVDPSTNTIWSHLTGEALLGTDKGKSLTALPVINTSWGEWKRLHPDTTTPSWDTEYRRYYLARVVSGRDFLPPMFLPTLEGLRDARLTPSALVLGVQVEGQTRAYPFEALAKAVGVVQETVGTTPLVAFYTSTPKTATAFDRRFEGKTLDFTRVPGHPGLFQDTDTHSEWTVEGLCVSGPSLGKQLTRLFSLQAEWYGWSAYFPQTTVYPASGTVKP
jgi:hypothetical protein